VDCLLSEMSDVDWVDAGSTMPQLMTRGAGTKRSSSL